MKDFRLINEAQQAMGDMKGQITGQAAGMSETGLAELNETLANFNAALPVLREAGCTMDKVNIDLGVPPKIVAIFSGGVSAPDEKIEAVLEEHSERSLTILSVKSVQQAAKRSQS